MVQFRCSEDNFDAIYICNDCTKTNMLCPNHYFTHQEEFPDHYIDRMKIPINKESKQILLNFLTSLKKRLFSLVNNIELDLWAKYSENKRVLMKNINIPISTLNLLILLVEKAQYIPMKMFYIPFEYFLHQPASKVLKYVNEFKFPETVDEFIDEWYMINFLHFNYFIFEDKKYIFGWNYLELFNDFNLTAASWFPLLIFLSGSEYEMAYEVLNNSISILEIIDKETALLFSDIAGLICNFIKNRNTSELIEQLKNLEAVHLKDDGLSIIYTFSWFLYQGLNQRDLMAINYRNQKSRIKREFPDWYLMYKLGYQIQSGDAKKILKFFKKIIKQPIKNYRIYLKLWISSWTYWIIWNIASGKKINLEKIVKKINKVVNSFENKQEFDEPLIFLKFAAGKFDDAAKIAWNLIKLHKKNRVNLYLNEAYLYLTLGMYYFAKFDVKKAHYFLINAKSSCGILGFDFFQVIIYHLLGILYFSTHNYKDALLHLEYVNKFSNNWHIFKNVKYTIGMVHYFTQNYEEALQYFIELEEALIQLLPNNYFGLFDFYCIIGRLYKFKKN